MALVLLCGQPCSGKSTAAACLVNALGDLAQIQVIDEPSLNLDRNQCYKDMPTEKNVRGSLRSTVDRLISKDKFVIVDSLNNIKGYRYELWCLARATGVRYCVLFCDVEEQECRAWNKKRQDEGSPCYVDKIFDDLVRRFERPERRNRWDSPLFELRPHEDAITDVSGPILETVAYLRGEKVAGAHCSRVLQPTIATQNVRVPDTNSLYELDRATQEVINALVDAQNELGVDAGIRSVSVGEGLPLISLYRTVGLPELRRHRRTFVRITGQSSLSGPPPPSDALSAKRMFADFLNRELKA
ncbi:hypothetical protein O6H91_07G014800 [Diphasiastrum complanatum]|uniref:Uncharacterized protein n=3 Tax=Diphasiastrum complanatum TaxID=34168 RepID=A0ACC2D2N8_DIPCM|nr:hypothetical protein O6H91_07G014800 [Diphasiastrum complanatum]KAJ7548517.1 hypothetical protein O6H91_07G014800 [Diphasiastrum complanatum]KAJ7548519.1 hypothetical protein O6H91_07G014800 [Diphasiastrum complanatum]